MPNYIGHRDGVECDRCDDMGDYGTCTCCGALHAPRTIVAFCKKCLREYPDVPLSEMGIPMGNVYCFHHAPTDPMAVILKWQIKMWRE